MQKYNRCKECERRTTYDWKQSVYYCPYCEEFSEKLVTEEVLDKMQKRVEKKNDG